MNDKRLRAIAYHEAGHAVSHFLNKLTFEKATIVADDDFLGQVVGRRLGKRLLDNLNAGFLSPAQRDRIERQIMALLAGEIAERHYTGRHNYRQAWSDHKKAADFCISLIESPEELPVYLRWLEIRSRNEITNKLRWPAVRALANNLLKHKTVKEKEAILTMRAALGIPAFEEQREDGTTSSRQTSVKAAPRAPIKS